MKIIALQGKANIGKTTVIIKLYQKIVALYKRKSYITNNNDGDFTAIIEMNKHIVGITSIGDSEKDLVSSFKLFEQNKCEVCVVCCHKKQDKGGSKKFVEKKANEYGVDIVWYSKAFIEQWNCFYNAGIEIDKINDIQANILLNELKEQLK